ncbi:hypothetical protein CMI46_03385 [Candidatus Pacearchaeota archaeon]|nr:hypothetical protein [Candidatus Pacearchaeota archaeon]|tara:strand:+ start:3982 stop:4638 length:657 start_codon:yes stop_codon:yes gene_type:complete
MKSPILKLSKELSKRNIFHKIEGNKILTRRSKTKIPEINEDIMYLLGVIEGDGSLAIAKRKRGGYHYMLRIYSGEETYLQYLKELFYKYFSIEGRINKDKRKNKTFWFELKNASIFFYFNTLGIKHGKKSEREILLSAKTNQSNLLNYLAGFVDTDGSISHKRIQLKQKSQTLLEDVKKSLIKLNLNPADVKINYTNNIPFYYIRFDNKLPLRLKQSF